MIKLSKKKFNEIRSYIYRHAKYLDIAIWRHNIEGGDADALLDALACYRNDDGGYAYGLDPDNENPESSPMMTWFAKGYFNNVEDKNEKERLVKGALDYLEKTGHYSEKGWHWAIPSNNHYPCRDYFAYPLPAWYKQDASFYSGDLMINISLFEYITFNGSKDSELYKRALRGLDYYMNALIGEKVDMSYMNSIDRGIILDYYTAFDDLEYYGIPGRYDVPLLRDKLIKLAEKYPSKESERFLKEYKNKCKKSNTAPESPEEKEKADEKALDDLAASYETRPGLWSKDGLKCDNPQEKYKNVAERNMWHYDGVMKDIIRLFKNNRIES
jgi:hypothetical protein